MPDIEIKTEGIGQLLRALNKVDKDLRSTVRAGLVAVAGMVSVEARQIAEQKGLRQSGDLIAGIRPGFRSSYAYVADTARHRGYNYPARIEFEKKYGDRSFLVQAVEHKQAES